MKIKWKVQPVPAGRYGCFQPRGWPTASYEDGRPAASIDCDDDYMPRRVRQGAHGELTVRVADYSVTPWVWRNVKQRAKTLPEAKALVKKVFATIPYIQPKQGD